MPTAYEASQARPDRRARACSQPLSPPVAVDIEPLPVVRLAEVEPEDPGKRWLVEGLWLRSGVGALGGHPKSLKTWCALDLALSVASGTPALGGHAVQEPGPVLVCAVEDSLQDLRFRFDQLAAARGVHLGPLDIDLLATPALRLDDQRDQDRLDQTLRARPVRLLVLDPFVRLVARVDENSSGDVSRVLGFLRALQREHDTAIVLVHHTRKNTSGNTGGHNLRGSSDFFAWVDSCLSLVRRQDEVLLHIEHRAARTPLPLRVRLVETPSLHLVTEPLDEDPAGPPQGLENRVLALLSASTPRSTNELRDLLRVRKQRIVDLLRRMEEAGLVRRLERGYTLPPRGGAPAPGETPS
ncbi:MAG: AAA family ATPase [Candidatus Bipolaricaulota bacterium]